MSTARDADWDPSRTLRSDLVFPRPLPSTEIKKIPRACGFGHPRSRVAKRTLCLLFSPNWTRPPPLVGCTTS